MVMLNRLIHIGECLSLHALRRINHQQRTFASSQGPTNLIGEIDMTRSVHEVQDIVMTVFRLIFQANRLRLDRNAPLFLNIHIVKNLGGHFPVGQAASALDQPVSQS